jgi:hypothetical protein
MVLRKSRYAAPERFVHLFCTPLSHFEKRPRDRQFLGPATEIIDPDLPLLELFWRSALPWAHVEGVPPANR